VFKYALEKEDKEIVQIAVPIEETLAHLGEQRLGEECPRFIENVLDSYYGNPRWFKQLVECGTDVNKVIGGKCILDHLLDEIDRLLEEKRYSWGRPASCVKHDRNREINVVRKLRCLVPCPRTQINQKQKQRLIKIGLGGFLEDRVIKMLKRDNAKLRQELALMREAIYGSGSESKSVATRIEILETKITPNSSRSVSTQT
jgi:hypothetical protein